MRPYSILRGAPAEALRVSYRLAQKEDQMALEEERRHEEEKRRKKKMLGRG